MKTITTILIALLASFITCAAQIPNSPGDVIITTGLNPMTQLKGYQVQLFTAPDTITTNITLVQEGLLWFDFVPPLRFADTEPNSPAPDKYIVIANDKVAYTETAGDWRGIFNCILSAMPGKYKIGIAAIGINGAIGDTSNLNSIEIK